MAMLRFSTPVLLTSSTYTGTATFRFHAMAPAVPLPMRTCVKETPDAGAVAETRWSLKRRIHDSSDTTQHYPM